MVEKKKQDPAVESPAPDEDGTDSDVRAAQDQAGNWEFINRIPSQDDVEKLLRTLPEWWGLAPLDFADYVQALPSKKKIMVPAVQPNGNTRAEEKRFEVVTLYFSVADRLQMCRAAQELHGWRVNYVPEETTPTGVPGFLQMDERLVYREYVEIWAPLLPTVQAAMTRAVQFARATNQDLVDDPNPLPEDVRQQLGDVIAVADTPNPSYTTRWFEGQQFELLGRRPGMAWVPESGGSQAKGSNPYEKVETAARGRALAAGGFGVLPGSGVASLEEMMGVSQNQQAMAGETGGRPNGGKREKPEELIAQILAAAEEARQLRGDPESWNYDTIRAYMNRAAGVDVATAVDQDGTVLEIDLTKVAPAALVLARNSFRDSLAKLKSDQELG